MGGYLTHADYAGSALGGFIAEQIESLNPSAPLHLTHYTSAFGMEKILEARSIRIRCIEKMNDQAEIRFSASVFRAHLDRRIAMESSSEFYQALQEMRRILDEGFSISNVYSLSFCEERDDLHLWSLYGGRRAGFSLSIDPSKAFCFRPEQTAYGRLWKCHYGEEFLSNFCTTLLDKAKQIFEEERDLSKSTDKEIYSDIEDYSYHFIRAISEFSPVFKPNAWSDEREWRWVFTTQPEESPPHIELPILNKDAWLIDSLCGGPECANSDIKHIKSLLSEMPQPAPPIYLSGQVQPT